MSVPESFDTYEKYHSFDNNSDHFAIDDLLDIPNEDDEQQEVINVAVDNVNINDKSNITVGDSSNSNSSSGCDHNLKDIQFSSELAVPQDDIAELEWLSNFYEDSFSSEELQKMQFISGIAPQSSNSSNNTAIKLESNAKNNGNNNSPNSVSEEQVPPKAKRSKRPRIPPCDWNSRLVAITDTTQDVVVAAQPPQLHAPMKRATKRKDNGDNAEGRKCLHCATDKTPQWRTGPLGPKTLCNACGVRYKSGRLVPEYRPAASPTFMLTKHSNSHRKVMELRRQKELKAHAQHMQNQNHQQQLFLHDQHHGVVFDVPNSDDYLIHQHMGIDFGGLI